MSGTVSQRVVGSSTGCGKAHVSGNDVVNAAFSTRPLQ